MIAPLLVLACSTAPPPAADLPHPNVVVITLDTTRASALGAWGGPSGVSPHLDAVAARGARFAWAFTHAPTTLNSHASLFTGLDPHEHGVPRNGYPLEEVHQTLAETLREAGYDTAGTVAASVLGTDTGIAQGFRLFDDQVRRNMGPRYEDRGDRVVDRALRQLRQRDRQRPLFLWVHLYDAHSPWEAPTRLQQRFADLSHPPTWEREERNPGPVIRAGRATEADMAWLLGQYHAEVAFVDEQVGRLLAGLEVDGVLADALVLFVADHGEMLGEERRRPIGHGPDVDLPVSHVPLALAGYGAQVLAPRVVEQPVRTSDVGSTLLGLAGLPATLGRGRDLRPLLDDDPTTTVDEVPIFLEGTRPYEVEAAPLWNNLPKERGVVAGGRLYVWERGDQDRRALYAVAPDQPRLDEPATLLRLHDEVVAWDAKAPPFREVEMSGSTVEALRALGYLE